MGWCPDSFCTRISPCRVLISPGTFKHYSPKNLSLISRPTRWLDHYQASLHKYQTAYIYYTLSCQDCKTRPTRNSSKPSRLTRPTLYKEVNTTMPSFTMSTNKQVWTRNKQQRQSKKSFPGKWSTSSKYLAETTQVRHSAI